MHIEKLTTVARLLIAIVGVGIAAIIRVRVAVVAARGAGVHYSAVTVWYHGRGGNERIWLPCADEGGGRGEEGGGRREEGGAEGQRS